MWVVEIHLSERLGKLWEISLYSDTLRGDLMAQGELVLINLLRLAPGLAMAQGALA